MYKRQVEKEKANTGDTESARVCVERPSDNEITQTKTSERERERERERVGEAGKRPRALILKRELRQ
jgi:hypothetical protein